MLGLSVCLRGIFIFFWWFFYVFLFISCFVRELEKYVYSQKGIILGFLFFLFRLVGYIFQFLLELGWGQCMLKCRFLGFDVKVWDLGVQSRLGICIFNRCFVSFQSFYVGSFQVILEKLDLDLGIFRFVSVMGEDQLVDMGWQLRRGWEELVFFFGRVSVFCEKRQLEVLQNVQFYFCYQQ